MRQTPAGITCGRLCRSHTSFTRLRFGLVLVRTRFHRHYSLRRGNSPQENPNDLMFPGQSFLCVEFAGERKSNSQLQYTPAPVSPKTRPKFMLRRL